VYDLRFGIRERNGKHEWKVSPPDYTRECTDKYIPKEHRKAVTDLLCKSLGVLTEHSGAKHLTMETFYTKLPDKALSKYKEICNFLEGCGFELRDEFRDEEKTGSLVASNKVGVAPPSQKHIARFAALKAAASVQKKESAPVRKKG
jgi:hypothetical protein